MNSLFKQIVEITSISGQEQELKNYIDKELRKYVDSIHTDALGNNIKEIGYGTNKVMLASHCDEVGFIITYIDEKGYAYFKPIGGIDKDIAIGQKVKVFTEKGIVGGVIGRDPAGEITKNSEVKDMWIDTGVTEKANHVGIGNRVFFDSYYEELQDNCIIARGADNKVGVYATTQITKAFSKKPNKKLKLVTVLSTQEEVNMGGAQVAVKAVEPKYSFIIDTIDTTDTPGASIEDQGEITIGKGPVISLGTSTDDKLFQQFKKQAALNQIPLQIIAEAGETSTDTDKIQIGNTGVISMVIYIPVRYMHTPNVLFNWNDVENTIKLTSGMLDQLEA